MRKHHSNDHAVEILRCTQWEPPSPGWIKCNFDASFRHENSKAGIRWIVRSHLGQHIEGMAMVENISSSL